MSYARKIDSTQAALVRTAKRLGAQWLPLRGAAVDGLLLWRDRTYVVDFKSKGGKKTPTQERLVQAGWPIVFIRTEEELLKLFTRAA